MNQELQSKMNNLYFQMGELVKDLKKDPSPDSVFCCRQVGTSMATLEMRVEEQWGIRLQQIPLEVPEPEVSVEVPVAVKSVAPAAPKKAKK